MERPGEACPQAKRGQASFPPSHPSFSKCFEKLIPTSWPSQVQPDLSSWAPSQTSALRTGETEAPTATGHCCRLFSDCLGGTKGTIVPWTFGLTWYLVPTPPCPARCPLPELVAAGDKSCSSSTCCPQVPGAAPTVSG